MTTICCKSCQSSGIILCPVHGLQSTRKLEPYSWLMDDNDRLRSENQQLKTALSSRLAIARTFAVPPAQIAREVAETVNRTWEDRAPKPEGRSPATILAICGMIFALTVISQLIWAFH